MKARGSINKKFRNRKSLMKIIFTIQMKKLTKKRNKVKVKGKKSSMIRNRKKGKKGKEDH